MNNNKNEYCSSSINHTNLKSKKSCRASLTQSTPFNLRLPNIMNKPFLIFLTIYVLLPMMINADRNYWDVLEIARGSSERHIKKAFQKKARKYHPDKCKESEEACHDKFVEINRAYEVLSDDNKRRVYNQHGEEGLKEHEKNEAARQSNRARGGGGGIFGDLFGFGGGGDDDPENKRGEDIEADIWLHLDEIYNGHLYDLSIFRQVLCPHCFGSGADSDDDINVCRKCGGTGTIMERRQIGIGFVQQIQKECPACGGKGKIITKKCRVCGGRGVDEGSHPYWVEVQRGTPNGHKILLENEGDETRDSKGGHLTFNVKTFKNVDKRTTGFMRDEQNPDDLHYFIKINLLQALVGYNINITHLDGHIVNIDNLPEDGWDSEVTRPLSIKTIQEEGMPIFESFPTRFGDLHVHFEVIFPENLTRKQRDGIAKLF